ncbi:hypothetical protein [Kutzneria chonburiensis]|uniref:FxLD family lantipeptide n=1 Tax=Kutzneria chonburiensis TaxID=1483604 RepID=A0ABV6N786_9PSEU|nr:hypothetical protein [Kutzneria chonburiensis]
MTAVLDDFELDIRVGDAFDRPLEMATTSDQGCDTNIACGTQRSDCVCPTDGSCHKTNCC